MYEEWCEDLPGTIETVLHWLEIPIPRDAVASRPIALERQTTARNDEWVARYRALRGRPTHETR